MVKCKDNVNKWNKSFPTRVNRLEANRNSGVNTATPPVYVKMLTKGGKCLCELLKMHYFN